MSDERQKILQMLEDGTITASEASALLEALPADEEGDNVLADTPTAEGEAGFTFAPAPPDSPDMDRFRRFWQIPFFIAVGVLLLSAFLMSSTYNAAEGRVTFWVVCTSGIFLLAASRTSFDGYSIHENTTLSPSVAFTARKKSVDWP